MTKMKVRGGTNTGPVRPQPPTLDELMFLTPEQRKIIMDMYSLACVTYTEAEGAMERLTGLRKKTVI